MGFEPAISTQRVLNADISTTTASGQQLPIILNFTEINLFYYHFIALNIKILISLTFCEM